MRNWVLILGLAALLTFVVGGLTAYTPLAYAAEGGGVGEGTLDWPIELKEDKDKEEDEGDPGDPSHGDEGDPGDPSHDEGEDPTDASEENPLDSGEDEEIIETPEEEDVEPVTEFMETPFEADEVVFCVDRTGSMAWPFKYPVIDEEGNKVFAPDKMKATVIEMKKTITSFSDNVKFNMVFWAHRWGRSYGQGHWVYTPSPGPEPANHWDPPGSDPDAITWQKAGNVSATDSMKHAAFRWIDQHAIPNGCTPLSDGCIAALGVPGVKTILLLTDGFPQTFRQTIYYADWGSTALKQSCMNRSRQEIKAANTEGVIIHTFFLPYNDPSGNTKNALCRQLLQRIAADNGGQFTEVGG
jgi:hypothetical protein